MAKLDMDDDADAEQDTGPRAESTDAASQSTPQPQPSAPLRSWRRPCDRSDPRWSPRPSRPTPISGVSTSPGTTHPSPATPSPVGVGAFGQIMFLGTWLAAMLPAPGNWVAAVVGAAFAEIGMIGAGNSSLTKRRAGGRWRMLFAVACFVCAGAVTMQMTHWMPKGFGVALVFGLGGFVGFLIHMAIQHSKLRDYEDRQTAYAVELAEYEAKRQERYAEDLNEYHATVTEQQRERREAAKATAPTPPQSATPRRRTKGGKVTKDDAIRIGRERGITKPAPLRDAIIDAGYSPPASKTTLENYCKELKALPNTTT